MMSELHARHVAILELGVRSVCAKFGETLDYVEGSESGFKAYLDSVQD